MSDGHSVCDARHAVLRRMQYRLYEGSRCVRLERPQLRELPHRLGSVHREHVQLQQRRCCYGRGLRD